MELKRGGGNSKKVAVRVSHDKEWVPSLMGEAELNGMLEVGVLPNCITTKWCLADGEPFPMSHTDEVVAFEDYF